MRQKHGLLLFLATCIPGCGQMHQGYMKRGVSLLLAFCGVLALSVLLNLGELAIFLPLVWLYAFFDSYNLRSQIAQNSEPEDAYLFGLSDVDNAKLKTLCRTHHSVIGWALLALGAFLFYRMAIGWVADLLSPLFDTWWLYSLLAYDVPRLLATVLLIALGLWFLRGPKKAGPEDDIPVFTPPAAPSGTAAAEEPTGTAAAEEPAAPVNEEEAPHGDD